MALIVRQSQYRSGAIRRSTYRCSFTLRVGRTVYSASFGASAGVRRETPFERERRAFRLLIRTLGDYEGQFVAIHDGRVVISDTTRNGVLRKFFSEHPVGTSVYIGFVGPTPVARVSAPALAHG